MNAIEAENLSKHYRVYLKPFDRLKESILRRPCHHLVTSLTDVSFQVGFGETLGIIGENGAGKSTLLKLLAGTTQPSSGRLARNGRIAALLELGAGFNPEFSGRTNIHLNAALLGLTEKEIRNREDSIIAFSELEGDIDRPVKTYSSGMHVRLAFSIATSVDPDVLIVDEALAVGDQRFSQKCIERMAGFRKAGKTIILCSHSLYLVGELCSRTLWLENGRQKELGPSSEVAGAYLAYLENKQADSKPIEALQSNQTPPDVVIEKMFLTDTAGNPLNKVDLFGAVVLKIMTTCHRTGFEGHLGVALKKPNEQLVFVTTTREAGLGPIRFQGKQVVELVIPSLPLVSGAYRFSAIITDPHVLHGVHDSVTELFHVDSSRPEFGSFWIEHQWRFGQEKAD
ncbi:MAG: ABC transporter ATP-binding protein [Pseudomonadota bacterium]